jgi:hypothetical protein
MLKIIADRAYQLARRLSTALGMAIRSNRPTTALNVDNNPQRAISGERTSMNAWAAALKNLGGRSESFAQAVLKEDESKLKRLAALSVEIGLPILDTFDFVLPAESEELLHLISRLSKADWKLTFRLTRSTDGILVYRDLDITVQAAAAIIATIPQELQYFGRLSPYKPAVISGTVLVSQGNICLELVHGPHFWLTKGTPDGVAILRCSYDFPYLSLRYSLEDPNQRLMLLRHLRDVVRLTLGLSIKQLAETPTSLYAEYLWREDLGYRFLDCSFSRVWTGPAVNHRDARGGSPGG